MDALGPKIDLPGEEKRIGDITNWEAFKPNFDLTGPLFFPLLGTNKDKTRWLALQPSVVQEEPFSEWKTQHPLFIEDQLSPAFKPVLRDIFRAVARLLEKGLHFVITETDIVVANGRAIIKPLHFKTSTDLGRDKYGLIHVLGENLLKAVPEIEEFICSFDKNAVPEYYRFLAENPIFLDDWQQLSYISTALNSISFYGREQKIDALRSLKHLTQQRGWNEKAQSHHVRLKANDYKDSYANGPVFLSLGRDLGELKKHQASDEEIMKDFRRMVPKFLTQCHVALVSAGIHVYRTGDSGLHFPDPDVADLDLIQEDA